MPPRKRKSQAIAEQSQPAVEATQSKKRKISVANDSKSAKKEGMSSFALAPRTAVASLGRPMYIGAHVSAAGGVQNAVDNASQIGANSFALFLKSQRKWTSPPLADEQRKQFVSSLASQGFSGKHIIPHGSYLVNLAQADKVKADQAFGNFVDDLKRCDMLGIKLYNFHPGSSGGQKKDEALGRIAEQLNRSHAATGSVVTLIENMAGSGNVLGAQFEDLRDIIAAVDDKSRVGVCLDTCHAFGAGYDLCTPEAFDKTMREFDDVVGLKYLKALHLNDSKAPLASHRDLHANIGTGFLGLRAFHSVMNFAAFENIPMVLETPIDRTLPNGKKEEDRQVWADEIKLLESLVGEDPEGEKFKELEKKLSEQGAAERKRIQDQVDRKTEKDAKKLGGKKGTKNGAATIDKMFEKTKKTTRKKPKKVEDEISEVDDLESTCSH